METSSVPFRLDEGVYLEDVDQIIRWNTVTLDLAHFLSPEIWERGKYSSEVDKHIQFSWKNHVCMGLPCEIIVTRLFGTPSPSAYHLWLDTCHMVSLVWHGDTNWSNEEIRKHLKQTYEHLKQHLGEISYCYPHAIHKNSFPSLHWKLPAFLISLNAHTYAPQSLGQSDNDHSQEKRDTVFSIRIEHEPEGYESLKAEAKRMRELPGTGLRFPYVEW